jgi:hypothetical protein
MIDAYQKNGVLPSEIKITTEHITIQHPAPVPQPPVVENPDLVGDLKGETQTEILGHLE